MKIFPLRANENWICDRFVSEWIMGNPEVSTNNILEADIVWAVAGWCWNQIPPEILASKKFVITIHHIVPEKFTPDKLNEFMYRDRFVDLYHVPCQKTRNQIARLTKKPIFTQPFWVNQSLWHPIDNKEILREKYKVRGKYTIGSFQRDTEGSDLKSPKLEKGPDIFCNIVESISKKRDDLHVILAGWRRQYVIKRLEKSRIDYTYYELPEFNIINELYNILDLYIVGSRWEGGPQSIVECASSETPIVSTDVGYASRFLSENSIFDVSSFESATPDTVTARENVEKYFIPGGFDPFLGKFLELLNEKR